MAASKSYLSRMQKDFMPSIKINVYPKMTKFISNIYDLNNSKNSCRNKIFGLSMRFYYSLQANEFPQVIKYFK